MASRILIDSRQQVGAYHVALVKLLSVTPEKIRPDGYKLNCTLIDLRINRAVLILDNHEPFGYHLHPNPLADHDQREPLVVASPFEAIDLFVKKAREMTNEK